MLRYRLIPNDHLREALVLVREVSEESYRLSHRMNLHKIVPNCLMSPQEIAIAYFIGRTTLTNLPSNISSPKIAA